MRILFLCPYFPLPAQGGGGTSDYYCIRNLIQEHEVHVIILANCPATAVREQLMRLGCTVEVWSLKRYRALFNVFRGLFNRGPLRVAYAYSAPLVRRVNELLSHEPFDLAIASHERMGQYIQHPAKVKRVIDLHDVVSVRHRMLARTARNPLWRLVHKLEARRIAAFEVACVKRFDAVWVSTVNEAARLRHNNQNRHVYVAPRGIDLNDFPYRGDIPDSQLIVFTGNMSYEPNVDAVAYYLKEIHPLVQELLPQSEFHVVGNYPHWTIVRAARRTARMTVVGPVPRMSEYLRRARVFVAPLRVGTGLRIKLLEAMAVGIPVVSTSVGCQGLGVKDREHLLVADRANDFAQAVKLLFEDRRVYQQLSKDARRFVEQNYSWEAARTALNRNLERLSELSS